MNAAREIQITRSVNPDRAARSILLVLEAAR